jgi:hypothetical protein
MPGEEALWRHKRGSARLATGNLDGARADLEAAAGPGSQDWVRGRAHADLARLAMRGGDREKARLQAARAESLCTSGSDPICVADARRLARSAHGR